jgi:hypothetical protein
MTETLSKVQSGLPAEIPEIPYIAAPIDDQSNPEHLSQADDYPRNFDSRNDLRRTSICCISQFLM